MIALGLIANLIPPTYSSGVDFQLLGRWAQKVPRWAWNSVGVVVYTVCALAGRDNLAAIFTNFLALMGYWVAVWIAVTVEEHLLFRKRGGRGWIWEDWNTRAKLPLGLAALTAFLVGWAGAILCMAQVWYVGPIAKLVGEYGADVSGLSFCSLRWDSCKPLRVRLAPEEGGSVGTEEAEGEERRDRRGWVEIGVTNLLTIFADGQLRRLLLGRARVSAAAMAGAAEVWAVTPEAVVERGRPAVVEMSRRSLVDGKE